MKKSFDIIIVGSGIGGLSTLLYLSETHLFKQGKLDICLIVKGSLNETNTNWAQGGIAAVNAIGDDFEKHISDTLVAGGFVNNKEIVEKVIQDALVTSLGALNNVTILEQTCVVNVTKHADNFFGLIVYDTKNKSHSNIFCGKLVLATGGLGMLYDKSTNQQLSTGDGIYLASQLDGQVLQRELLLLCALQLSALHKAFRRR